MQKVYRILFVVMAGTAVVCCSTKKEAGAAKTSASKEASLAMDAYHKLMAESFHPFMDSGNLAPAKAHADELASAAARWAELGSIDQSDKAVESKLERLKTDTHAFADLVKKGSDEAIGKSLENLHHEFHELIELWSNEPTDNFSK